MKKKELTFTQKNKGMLFCSSNSIKVGLVSEGWAEAVAGIMTIAWSPT